MRELIQDLSRYTVVLPAAKNMLINENHLWLKLLSNETVIATVTEQV